MLFISQANSAPPQLLGMAPYALALAGGNPAVIGLQTSLTSLAQVTGRTAINPGAADGIVGTRTMSAVVAAFGFIAEKLPSEARTAIQIGLIAGGMTNQAKELVTRYASYLDAATRAAILKYTTGSSPPTPGTMPDPYTGGSPAAPTKTPSFFTTPLGIGAIAIGVIGSGLLIWALVSD